MRGKGDFSGFSGNLSKDSKTSRVTLSGTKMAQYAVPNFQSQPRGIARHGAFKPSELRVTSYDSSFIYSNPWRVNNLRYPTCGTFLEEKCVLVFVAGLGLSFHPSESAMTTSCLKLNSCWFPKNLFLVLSCIYVFLGRFQ